MNILVKRGLLLTKSAQYNAILSFKSTSCVFLIIHRNNWITDLFCLALFLLLFYTVFLGSYPLFTPDEGRYAEIALNMIHTSDYITPRVNGAIFLDKPILYFWLQACAIKLLGVNEWAVRLFPALFGILGVIITYSCGRVLFDRRSGLIAAIILATTPLYFGGTHYANLDLEVAVLISCSLLTFLSALYSPHRLYFLFIAYASAALAFLTKGLIGFVFPIMIIGTWVLLTKQWRVLKKIYFIPGLILIMSIVTPWYILVQKANPSFIHYFFVGQQITRYLSGRIFNNQMPIWFFIPVILIGFLPWIFFVLPAFLKSISPENPIKLFLLLWVTIVFTFFSIPHSKLVGYILPIFPPFALLVGHYLSATWNQSKRFLFIICVSVNIIFLLTLTASASYLNRTSVKPLALQLQHIIQPQDEVVAYFRYYQDIPFYFGQHITVAADWSPSIIEQNDNWLREFWNSTLFENKKNNRFINEYVFWQRWQTKHLLVLVSANRLDQFRIHTKNYSILGEYNNVFLISNSSDAIKAK